MGNFLLGNTEDASVQGYADTLTDSQNKIFKKLGKLLRGNMGEGVEPYSGQYSPDATENQQGAFDFVQNLLSGGNAGYNQGMAAVQGMLDPYDPQGAREYWETSVKDPAMLMFQDEILPQTLEPFVGQGALDSGASRRAAMKAGTDLTTGLNATLADVLYRDKTQHTQDQLNAMPMLQSMLQTPVNMGLSTGAAQYGIEAAKGAEDYSKWQSEQAYNNPWLNFLMPYLGMQVEQPIVQGPTQQTGFLQDVAVPLVGAGLSSGSWF